MEGNAPERRRRLITYGKSSKDHVGRDEAVKCQSQQPASIAGSRNGLWASSQFRPQLQSQPQIPEMDHDHGERHPTPKRFTHHSIRSTDDRIINVPEFTPPSDDRQQNLRISKRRRTLVRSQELVHQKDDVFGSASKYQSLHDVPGTSGIGSNSEWDYSAHGSLSSADMESTRRGLRISAGSESTSRKSTARHVVSAEASEIKYDSNGLESAASYLRPHRPYRESISNIHPKDISPVGASPGLQHNLSDLTYQQHLLSTSMPSGNIVPQRQEGSSTRRRLVDSLGIQGPIREDPFNDLDENDRLTVGGFATASDEQPSEDRQTPHQPLESRHRKAEGVMNATISSQSGGSKITYARQRSFLSNVDLPEDLRDIDTHVGLHQHIRDPPEPSNPAPSIGSKGISELGSVRSIHELRQAGVNARFQGIVDSIFEDVEDTANLGSVRRDGLIRLCEKLLDRQFAQRFVESGSFRRLASCITTRLDAISSYLAICAYDLILCIGAVPSSVTMSFWPRILTMIPSLLPMDEDISTLVAQRRYSLSRANQAAIRDLSSRLRESTVLTEQLPSWLSPQRVLLHSMQLTIRKFRERGETTDVLPDFAVSALIQLLLKHSLHAPDLEIISKDFLILELTFSILEAYATLPSSLADDHQNALKSLTQTSHLLFSLGVSNEGRSRQLLISHLRLILNITNNNPRLCEDFATPELVQGLVEIVLTNFKMASGDFIGERKDSLDIVILTLGALINLTEESGTSRNIILTLETDSCSLLEHLILLFSMGFDTISDADSVVQTHSNVAFGYLSILLCTLCLDMQIRSYLRTSLGGTGLGRVLATVDEFLHYHRKVDEELQQAQAEKDPLIEFTTRLQGILNQIRGTAEGI